MGDLVRDLRERGVVGTRGRPFSVQTLTRVLTNPRYAGLREYKGEVLDGVDVEWEPLVDRATWEASVARLSAPSRKRGKGHSARKHLLSGLMQCGICGETMQSRPSRQTARYGCPGGVVGQGCGRVFISGEGADNIVAAAVLAELTDPAVIRQISRAAKAGPDRSLVEDLRAAEARKGELLDLYREGVLDKAEFTTERRVCEDRIEAVRGRLSAQDGASVLASIPTDPEALAEAWDGWTLAKRRAVVSAVVDSITVMPGRRGHKGVDPNRLKITYRG